MNQAQRNEAARCFIPTLAKPEAGRFAILADLPRGEYLRWTPESKKTYIKGDYDRASKTFSLIDTEDHCREIFRKGNAVFFVGFDY